MSVKNRKRLIIIVVVIAVVGAVAYWYFQRRSHNNSAVIHVSGNIEVTDTQVSFKIPGHVVQRLVDEGELVEKGAVVALLETADLRSEVAMRQAELEAAKAALAELEAGSRPQEIAAAEATVARAKADAVRAELDYHRMEEWFRSKAVSSQELDAARAANDVAAARLREAEEQFKLVKEGPRKEKIEQARAMLEQAKQALALAETQLSYATVAAPLSGVVLSKNIEPGEYVVPGTPVVTIGDLDKPWLRAYVNETDLGRVKVGQKARVTADTYPGKIYEGHVSFIASDAEFTPKSVQTEKERVKLVYRVKIDIANPHMELKPGMPADAEILVSQETRDGRNPN